jgi:hypothetical protein
MNHRIVESNGIKMHLAEDGEGMRSGKNPLWICSVSPRFLRVLYEAPLSPSEVTGVAQLQLSISWRQFNPASQAAGTARYPSESLPAGICAPSQPVLFPDAEQRQG